MTRIDQHDWERFIEEAVLALTHLHLLATRQIGAFSEEPLTIKDVRDLRRHLARASAATAEVGRAIDVLEDQARDGG